MRKAAAIPPKPEPITTTLFILFILLWGKTILKVVFFQEKNTFFVEFFYFKGSLIIKFQYKVSQFKAKPYGFAFFV